MSTTTTKKSKTAAVKSASKSAKPAGTKAASASKAPVSALDGSAPAPKANPAAAPNVVEAAQSVVLGPVMRKKELVDAVVSHSGMKKKDVKPVVESMLEVLGSALADKRELNLQPLGRIKVRREKQLQNGRVLITKVRQSVSPEKDSKMGSAASSDTD